MPEAIAAFSRSRLQTVSVTYGKRPDDRARALWREMWFYVRGRRVFGLVLSNPDAVKLYRMTTRQYIAVLSCKP